jgi:hypothetical protein
MHSSWGAVVLWCQMGDKSEQQGRGNTASRLRASGHPVPQAQCPESPSLLFILPPSLISVATVSFRATTSHSSSSSSPPKSCPTLAIAT